MYEIISNEPIPIISKGRKPKYPFAKMEIGDSILIHGDRWDENHILAARRSAGQYATRHEGYRFQTVFTDVGLKIWRIDIPTEPAKDYEVK